MMEKVDRVSEAFVLADIGHPETIRDLRESLEALRLDLPSVRMVETVDLILRVVSRIGGGGEGDAVRSWEAVEKGISALQAMAAAPAAADAAAVPSELLHAAERSRPEGGAPKVLHGIDAEILSGFIVETREHLEAAEIQLLALESDGTNVDALHTVFRAFHTIKGAASCLDLTAIHSLAHETESLLDCIRRDLLSLAGPALDFVFQAVDAMKRLATDAEEALKSGTLRPAGPQVDGLIGQIRHLAGSAVPDRADVEAAKRDPLSDPTEDESLRPTQDSPSSGSAFTSDTDNQVAVKEPIRVDPERLDRLVDLIGELVIAEAMVSQSPDLSGLGAGSLLGKSVSQLDKITRELQEMGMSLRMVPVRPLFHKMARLARDLSRKLSKPIEFVTSGEEIELDKAIVNCVTDALVHIIRNALDHGIENDPADRVRSGKSPAGRVELRACHREGCIVIEVEDDGRGLDSAAILAKAVEKGIVRRGEGLSESEIFRLIFLPGFSTASVVTELSGRGVGLDVVRTSVESLRGRIEIESEPGRGTTLRLRLPLTLAIIDGMVLRAGRERYVVPTLSITRLVRPGPDQRSTVLEHDELLLLHDESIPMFELNHLLDVRDDEARADWRVAVVIEDAGRRVALLADEVIGQQQIVIKSLGVDLERVPGISGGVILPDGQVGLILDVNGLLMRMGASGSEPVKVA